MASRRVMQFALVFVFFFVVCPALLDTELKAFPLLHGADIAEMVSSFFVIPAYWMLFDRDELEPLSKRARLAFVLLTTLLVLATGAHVAGNSIQHLMEFTPGEAIKETAAYRLALFFHKPFSHLTESVALGGLSLALVLRKTEGSRIDANPTRSLALEAIAALLYGFSFFCFHTSGKISALGIAFAATVFGVAWITRRTRRASHATRAYLRFFALGMGVFLVLTIGWAIYWQGMPNFTETGMIQ